MLLHQLLEGLPGTSMTANAAVRITGITHDSRRVEPGFLFVAIRGANADGSRFIGEAFSRGAAAVASESAPGPSPAGPVIEVGDARAFLAAAAARFYGYPTRRLKLAAVTGTNGKTTTAFLVDAILRSAGLKPVLAGTIGMRAAGEFVPNPHTTPEAPDLMRFLKEAADEGCTHGVMEVSSHALAMKRVLGAKFAAAIFCNLTPEHLDFHGDMETYYQAKRLLFVPEGGNDVRTAIVNTDDAYGRRLARETACAVLRFGESESADIRLMEARYETSGSTLRLRTPRGEVQLQTRLVGRPNGYNILAAAGASLAMGIDLAAIRDGIERLDGIPGRMEKVEAGQRFTVIVDYAHTPDALEKLLETLRSLPHGRIITVFGCGGDRDREKRPVMGRIAGRLSQLVIATSDNPRSENPLRILEQIESGLRQGSAEFQLVPDRRQAIERALAAARANDVVVIAGKGHETQQIAGGRTIPFDDRLVAAQILGLSDHDGGGRNQ